MMTLGDRQGGDLFTEQPGSGTCGGTDKAKRSRECSWTPRAASASLTPSCSAAPSHGRAGYTARTFPEATRDERKLLRDLGFRGPDHQELRATNRPSKSGRGSGQGPQVSTRPGQSRRRALWKTASALSILFTTALSVNGRG